MDPAYVDAVQDLLAHDVVKQMTEYPHHDQTTLAHSLVVSQVSFQLAKKFKADARSTARGALLHDLFLYSWRDHQGISHVVNHPKIALANAQKHFQLNEVETDIILKHMWPLCRRFFRYREAFIVSMVDKIVATKEAIAMLNQFINQKMN
ncbi:MAG: hypothetical protein A2004_10485 [Spirochaetes bacterium GWC1_61_12]|nr:MAG: hypothetical protein A2Y37_05345 [Spirochaetes bacterium GWB1_60_80]OHD34454.1 MAG: hypothetical protein A2004_10485 [Spirochaetes bacterium GWC1_61_12]OHD43170.1 MAG: hypothetical protein A2Y35_01150 [Spirochaetes bacterium GWE1_60_18]OHD58745.1 MAG: hypothetical protein A2Y32_01635 [Spirochaetes bacterium GWF1_60_12]